MWFIHIPSSALSFRGEMEAPAASVLNHNERRVVEWTRMTKSLHATKDTDTKEWIVWRDERKLRMKTNVESQERSKKYVI